MSNIKEININSNIISYLKTNDNKYSLLFDSNHKTYLLDIERNIMIDTKDYILQQRKILEDEHYLDSYSNTHYSLLYILNSQILIVFNTTVNFLNNEYDITIS